MEGWRQGGRHGGRHGGREAQRQGGSGEGDRGRQRATDQEIAIRLALLLERKPVHFVQLQALIATTHKRVLAARRTALAVGCLLCLVPHSLLVVHAPSAS